MADLLTVAQVEARMGTTLNALQAAAIVTDVSAQARKVARPKLDDIDHTNINDEYPELVPVLVSAVERSLVNPSGFGSEMLDGYRFEQAPQAGRRLTKEERRDIRGAVGMNVQTVTLVSPWSGDIE